MSTLGSMAGPSWTLQNTLGKEQLMGPGSPVAIELRRKLELARCSHLLGRESSECARGRRRRAQSSSHGLTGGCDMV